jgi:hypothetical protein
MVAQPFPGVAAAAGLIHRIPTWRRRNVTVSFPFQLGYRRPAVFGQDKVDGFDKNVVRLAVEIERYPFDFA